MRANNTPQGALSQLPQEKVKMLVSDLMELHQMGTCKDDEDVEQRIQQYFDLCRTTSIRPGVESLAAALHVDRVTVWRWEQGEGCSPRRQDAIKAAKSMISAFVEQCALSGAVNPVTAIFLMKNWMKYRDSYSFEDATPRQALTANLSPEEIAERIREDIPIDVEDVPQTAQNGSD